MAAAYIIGEIGQNHNGSVEIAKKIIDVASLPIIDWQGDTLPSVNAVKLTKRDLNEELTASEMARPYESRHSFGKTYGEHRAYLELSDEEHLELYHYAKSKSLDLIETMCAKGCLSLLNYFQPDRIKVASRDLTNLPLLSALAETKIPMILSTGMASERELDEALTVITKYHENISILHCLSQYPAEFQNINLNSIPYLKQRYAKYTIGYSDHSVGISVPVAAIALGAEIIEKHITISRRLKGSDQEGSLGPEGLFRMMRDIRHIEAAMGKYEMTQHPASLSTRQKLERSIAAKRNILPGAIISAEDIYLLSPGTGLPWNRRGEIIGKYAHTLIKARELITPEQVSSTEPLGQRVDTSVRSDAR